MYTMLNWLQSIHFISQPALLETSGWLVLEPLPTRVVWRCATMEHGELCVMISGVVWMQVWPADNWASLETVSVYCCHCCCSIHIVCCIAIWKFVISSQVSFLFYRCNCILPCFLWPGNWIHLARQCAMHWHWVQTVRLPCQFSWFTQLWPLWGC